jgi:hypothetical protein
MPLTLDNAQHNTGIINQSKTLLIIYNMFLPFSLQTFYNTSFHTVTKYLMAEMVVL